MAPKIDPQNLRETFGRFRVLIVGRANAGKTTILQKVCNTTEKPEIYDAKGRKIDAVVVEGSRSRGNHEITNEMVFKSNSGFVFHDSCGFEAGSVEEFEEMKRFISERANATKLEERLHAIWYCIPMDDHCRTFQRSEEKFFSECNTGNVPIIAVFTKFEALCPVAFGELEDEFIGLSSEECLKRIAHRVEELFKNTQVLDRLCDINNLAHPKGYVRLENMNQPNTNCDTLVECTTFALDDKELRLYLVSTQQSNLELCIKCAVGVLVNHAHWQLLPRPTDHEAYQLDLAKWFLHLYLTERSVTALVVPRQQMPNFNHGLFNTLTWRGEFLSILQPLARNGTWFTTANGILRIGIATILVLEYSAFLRHDSDDELGFMKSAVDHYVKSPTAIAVEKVAREITDRGYKKEELKTKILEFILENRMSKELLTKK